MSRLWRSILSIWAWLVLAGCILLWFPLMALLRLVTAWFDPGRYAVGYLFRSIWAKQVLAYARDDEPSWVYSHSLLLTPHSSLLAPHL